MATDQTLPAFELPFAEAFIPPLEAGDRLTRAEFERRYHAMPSVKRAVLEALQVGIATQEHAAFVKRLQERQSSPR